MGSLPQVQEAARPAEGDQQPDEYLPLVLRTFICGFPHQYQAPAEPLLRIRGVIV